jgi:hypothetical protein
MNATSAWLRNDGVREIMLLSDTTLRDPLFVFFDVDTPHRVHRESEHDFAAPKTTITEKYLL